MNTCRARLPIGQRAPLGIIYDAQGGEWPHHAYRRCGQSVGVTIDEDGYGNFWYWCAIPGHREDVEDQMHASDKARFDLEQDMRAAYGSGPAGEDSPTYRADMIAAGRGGMLR